MAKNYYYSPAMAQLESLYNSDDYGQRLGQFFCNNFIEGQWSYLFYMEDDMFARRVIAGYLRDHQYYEELPVRLKV